MSILVTCKCGQQYLLADEWAGKPALCQICRTTTIVPASAQTPEPLGPMPPSTALAHLAQPAPGAAPGARKTETAPENAPPLAGRVLGGHALTIGGFLFVLWAGVWILAALGGAPASSVIRAVFFGWAGWAMMRLGKRLRQPRLDEMFLSGGPAPVLFLRPSRSDRQGATARAAYEDELVKALELVGPVAAVGRAGAVLQPLGALRTYELEDGWRDAVRELAAKSALVAMVLSGSPDEIWELQESISTKPRKRLVLIFPPERLRSEEWRQEWSPFFADVAGRPDLDPAIQGIAFEESGYPVLLRCADASMRALLECLKEWCLDQGLIPERKARPPAPARRPAA